MLSRRKWIIPILTGAAGITFLSAVYFGIVSLAESPRHAVDLFRQEQVFILPIILGFGIQSALYAILKFRLFAPDSHPGPGGPMIGAGGATSTVAMVACCAHHVTDVLPILGLTAAAAFLARYQRLFMVIGLMTTITGIFVMGIIIWKERRKAAKQRSYWVEISGTQ